MSTRGLWGYVVGEEEKLTYNHSDSYPSWLGVRILSHAGGDLDEIRSKAGALILVDEQTTPTEAEREKLSRYSNLSVGSQSDADWYCLLRDAQGEPGEQLEAGYMIEGAEFALDSLFCEWGYVIDLDAGMLEVYSGFQKEAHDAGRFAGRAEANDSGYYPIRMVAAWSLGGLPSEDKFLAALEE